MSTQNPIHVTQDEWVKVIEAQNGIMQVLEGTVWVRSGAEAPDISNPPAPINGRIYWGHQYTSGGVDAFHDYGVGAAENVYVLAASDSAVVVITNY